MIPPHQKWSFYGASEPRWLLASAWILLFAMPIVIFFAMPAGHGPASMLIYCPVTAIITLYAAWKLRSWLLVFQGIVMSSYYLLLAYPATIGLLPSV